MKYSIALFGLLSLNAYADNPCNFIPAITCGLSASEIPTIEKCIGKSKTAALMDLSCTVNAPLTRKNLPTGSGHENGLMAWRGYVSLNNRPTHVLMSVVEIQAETGVAKVLRTAVSPISVDERNQVTGVPENNQCTTPYFQALKDYAKARLSHFHLGAIADSDLPICLEVKTGSESMVIFRGFKHEHHYDDELVTELKFDPNTGIVSSSGSSESSVDWHQEPSE